MRNYAITVRTKDGLVLTNYASLTEDQVEVVTQMLEFLFQWEVIPAFEIEDIEDD